MADSYFDSVAKRRRRAQEKLDKASPRPFQGPQRAIQGPVEAPRGSAGVRSEKLGPERPPRKKPEVVTPTQGPLQGTKPSWMPSAANPAQEESPKDLKQIIADIFAPVEDTHPLQKAQDATGPSSFRKTFTGDTRTASRFRKEQVPDSVEASYVSARREMPKKMSPQDEETLRSAVFMLGVDPETYAGGGKVDQKELRQLITRFRKDKAGVQREVEEFRANRDSRSKDRMGVTGKVSATASPEPTEWDWLGDQYDTVMDPAMKVFNAVDPFGNLARQTGADDMLVKGGQQGVDAIDEFFKSEIGQTIGASAVNPLLGLLPNDNPIKQGAAGLAGGITMTVPEAVANYGRMVTDDPSMRPRDRVMPAAMLAATVLGAEWATYKALTRRGGQLFAKLAGKGVPEDIAKSVDSVLADVPVEKLDEFVPQDYTPGVVPDLKAGLDEVPPGPPPANQLNPTQKPSPSNAGADGFSGGKADVKAIDDELGDVYHGTDSGGANGDLPRNGQGSAIPGERPAGQGQGDVVTSRTAEVAPKSPRVADIERDLADVLPKNHAVKDVFETDGGTVLADVRRTLDSGGYIDTRISIAPDGTVKHVSSHHWYKTAGMRAWEQVPYKKPNWVVGAESQKYTPTAPTSPAFAPDVPVSSADAVPKAAPKVEDVPPAKPPKAVPDEPVKATGLANQVQAREAADGALDEVLSSTGKSAKEWQKVGEDILNQAERPDYEDLAYRVGKGDEELTGEKVGILLAGKRRMLANLNDLAAKLKTDPTNGKLRREYEDAREAIRDYEQNIQAGKGRWSDVGRSLQGGADVDTGDFAAVIAEAERFGKTVDPKTAAKLEAETAKVAELQKKLDDLEKAAPEARAQELVKAARTSPRANKTQIQQNITKNREALKKAWASSGVKGGKRGGAVGINPDIAPIIRELATDYVKLGVANLDDVVKKIQQVFKEETGESISRQDVIDNMSAEGPTRTRSEIQKEIDRIRREAKAQSTGTKAEQAAKAKVSAARQKAREAERKVKELDRQEARRAAQAEKSAEATRIREAKAKAQAQAKAAQEKERAARKVSEDAARRLEDVEKSLEGVRKREAKAKANAAIKAADAKVRQAVKDAADAQKRIDALDREAARRIEQAENSAETARQRAARAQAEAKARQAKLEADTLAKQAEKEFGDMWRYQDRVLKMEDEIDRLRGELDEGRFLVTPKRKAPVDKQLEDLRAEKDIYDARVRKMIDNHNLSRPAKIIKGTVGLVRGLQLGADLGMLTRQGLFAWARPVEAARAVGNATKAAFSEVQAVKYTRAINERRVDGKLAAVARKKAGLQLSDMYNDPEEISFTQLVRAIPGLRNFGGGLERFQHVFINQIRADTFDRALKLGYDEAELKARARFINAATGRGAKVPGAIGDALDVIMTSPRYEASRWQLLADPAISGVQALKGNRGARDNMKQMAVTAAEIIGLMKVAELAGYELQYDPSHTDFGKLRKGDKTWDVTAGIAPRLRDVVRMGLAAFGPDWGEDVVTTGSKIASRTISPVKQLYSQGSIAYQRAIGNPNPKDPLSGFKSEEEREGIIAFAPLIAQSMIETWGIEGPVAAATEGIKEFIGGSTGRYPKNTKPTMLQKSVQKAQGTYKYPTPKKKQSQFPPPSP